MNRVYCTDMLTGQGNSLEDKFRRLLATVRLDSLINEKELIAIKIHSGEIGNTTFINHNFARIAANEVKSCRGIPFLTDTNTLYSGGRKNAVDHIHTATMHAFCLATTGAPFIVADGLRGLDYGEIDFKGKHIRKARIASAILQADKLIMLSHFKGHGEIGFGGTIKNLGMGCASIAGKLEQHSSSKPKIEPDLCVACRQCSRNCPEKAISFENGKAIINYDRCIGCGQCVASCSYKAAQVIWGEDHEVLIEKLCEYAAAVHHKFLGRAIYVNFALNITPDCDCWGYSSAPFMPDAGILVSHNPLALDRATMDLINKPRTNKNNKIIKNRKPAENVFDQLRKGVRCEEVFKNCLAYGMDDSYEMVQVD